MASIQKHSKALDSTLKSDALLDVNVGIAETLLDGVLNEGLAKDLPIIGSIIGLAKTGVQVRDYLFLKKIVSFLTGLNDVPTEQREEMISKIDETKEYRTTVGEKLLYIIDRCEDHEKAEIIALLFRSFLNKEITYSTFLRANRVVDNITIHDLNWVLERGLDQLPFETASDYLTCGYFEIKPTQITVDGVKDRRSWDSNKLRYEVKGGELLAVISPIGKTIRKILSANKRK